MDIELVGLPVPKPLIGLENLRFYPNTLTNVDVYINNVYNDTCNVSVVDDYCYISTKLYYPSDTPADAIVTFTSSGYDYFSVSRPEITASSSENPILVTFHPAVAIPNITVNDSDYWETHKSEYNALIGNPVGTFKLDLSEYATNSTVSITDPSNLYSYVDINGTEIVNYTVNKDSMKNLMIRILPKSSS